MDEDLDQIVERCANMLRSLHVPEKIREFCDLLHDISLISSEGKELCTRIVRELAVYEGGAILKRLLTRVLWEVRLRRDTSESYVRTLTEYTLSCQAMASLTGSKVLVERCLSVLLQGEKQVAQQIYERLTENALKVAGGVQGGQQYGALIRLMVVAPLECMSNFLRVSRIFRDGMRESLGGTIILDSLGLFLSAGFLDNVSEDDATLVQYFLSSVVASLAFYTDSQTWALDEGLLEMLVAIVEASPVQQLWTDAERNISSVFRCTGVLLRLLETEATAEKLRAHNALTSLRPHKQKFDGAYPKQKPWDYIEMRSKGGPSDEEWKIQAEVRGTYAGIVCSWKHCTAGRELASGKKFGKCGECQVARYCR